MPISVTFPEPLDHGLLLRAIGVRRDGRAVIGEVQVDAHETRWTMTPASPWTPGRYEVIALGILEDLAGNRIGRAFEVDEAHRPASEDDAKVTTVPFTLAALTSPASAPAAARNWLLGDDDRGRSARSRSQEGQEVKEKKTKHWFSSWSPGPPVKLTGHRTGRSATESTRNPSRAAD